MDAAECEDVMHLLLGANDSKTGKFPTEPRKRWNYERASDYDLLSSKIEGRREFDSNRIVNIIAVNESILLDGFYNVQTRSGSGFNPIRLSPVELTIKEQPINENQTPVVVSQCHLIFTDNQETYHQLEPKAIILKPDFEYHFEFVFESRRIIYDRFELTPEIKIDEHVLIKIPSKGDNNDQFLMKKIKIITP